MFRPTALRLAASRAVARPVASSLARPPVLARPARSTFVRARGYANEAQQPASGGGNNQMLIVLAAIVALGAGGYYYLKPVRDVASLAHETAKSVQEQGGKLGEQASQLGSLAKGFLPPGAFALYTQLSQQPGGINGFLSNLKDKDLQGVIDEVKKVGGDDVKRIVEKVEKKVKDAGGKVEKIDWHSLADDLKKELPQDKQKYVDMLVGQLPSKEDFQQYIDKAKKIGEEKLKDVEGTASKILQQVEKAKKEGKGQADAFLAGLKQAAPADVDTLIKQLKDAAKSAGLPADTAEAWLKSKAEDGKINAEELGKQVEDKLRQGARAIPGEPKDLISEVEKFSPSVAKLLSQALQQVGVIDEKGNKK